MPYTRFSLDGENFHNKCPSLEQLYDMFNSKDIRMWTLTCDIDGNEVSFSGTTYGWRIGVRYEKSCKTNFLAF